jgi:hypothetical protein
MRKRYFLIFLLTVWLGVIAWLGVQQSCRTDMGAGQLRLELDREECGYYLRPKILWLPAYVLRMDTIVARQDVYYERGLQLTDLQEQLLVCLIYWIMIAALITLAVSFIGGHKNDQLYHMKRWLSLHKKEIRTLAAVLGIVGFFGTMGSLSSCTIGDPFTSCHHYTLQPHILWLPARLLDVNGSSSFAIVGQVLICFWYWYVMASGIVFLIEYVGNYTRTKRAL